MVLMSDNLQISALLRLMTAIEVWVLIFTGFGLFFFYGLINTVWPWALTPFNAGFLGSIYLSALFMAAILVKEGTWYPARMITAMIFVFTTIVFIVSIAYLPVFDQSRTLSFWGWLILYTVLPINAAYHLWLYRNVPAAPTLAIPAWLKTLLLIHVLFLGIYGFALLIFPSQATAFWPWPIDEFHGRMYSVAAFTPAVGALLAYLNPNLRELKVLSWTQILGGLLPILGLLVVDLSVHRVNWSFWGTWLWIGFALWLLFLGVLLMRETRKWYR
jgi:hypothetical protein